MFLLYHYNLPLENEVALNLNKLESSSSKNTLCQVLFKISPVALEKNIFTISIMHFRYFVITSPWRRVGGPSIEQTRDLYTQECFVPSLVEIGTVALEEEIFFTISIMNFRYFVIISPYKRAGLFIWINVNSLHPRMLCTKFSWNWPNGSGEEEENVKSLWQQRLRWQQRRRLTTDKLWSEKLTSAQVS